ncbi:hypothetical protein ABD91_21565 [Lysinibacillus sphaericus]|uniref:hypothetical protein n=1 Tax=Lysinibacillus sphaericus TaxID=1421 RepID=UPI0018CE5B6E|nr:hypothetical protein [Lysinibacillus sphaericus]MBG9693326.1 hypothetical protein [Lysinibacillus sphaericus]
MEFGLKSESYNFGGTLTECITFLQSMNVMLAIHVDETGLNFSMMLLNFNKSITIEDDVGREITITRIK